ncbi:MAG: flagellar basal-body rod protein FlgF [Hyphomonadaceae bacterium]|nr:flagellar basal-body rod protein FlgF [Hyphomonadaceae bacterium]
MTHRDLEEEKQAEIARCDALPALIDAAKRQGSAALGARTKLNSIEIMYFLSWRGVCTVIARPMKCGARRAFHLTKKVSIDMDNTLLITLSAQNALRRQMDVAANNMANMSTAGFKAEAVLFEPVVRRPAAINERPKTVEFVRDYTIARDFRPGALQRTDNPLDFALTGNGYFTIQTTDGNAYTRDGQFQLDTDGRLVTHDGRFVLDDGGQIINLDVTAGQPLVGRDGTIVQNGAPVARLGLAAFNRPGAMDKIGDNLWRPNGEQANPATDTQVVQGMIEGSNVVAITELTRIMEISRAFESASRLQKQTEDLRGRAIERLAKLQS